MKSLQALREARAAIAKKIRNLLDPAVTKYTKEVEIEVDGLYAEVTVLDGQISRIERSVAMSDDLEERAHNLGDENGRSTDENAHQIVAARKAFVKLLRNGPSVLSPEERALVLPADANGRGIRNIAEGTNTAGGYLVPTILMPNLLQKLKYFGGMRDVATIMATSGGYPIAWATTDETANAGELVAENVAASTGDATFGQVTINAYKFSSKIIPVSFEVLQDSSVDVESFVLGAIAIRIARGQNTYFTIGTGTSQPQGALTAAALGVTLAAGNTTSITFDGLMDLYHAVDPAYRVSPNCSYMMNDSTFKAVKKLKDTSNRPLWLPQSTVEAFAGDGGFDTLNGKRLVINQDMPNMAANAKPVLFGDFSKYMIRDVMEVQILRFTDSAYTSKGQIGFLGWARADGRLIDASNASLAYLANSAT
ncbi:phage major capsid protein [Methylocella silvestris]|nr:phage major capsid protein [Methylocella silvestris]